VTAVDDELDGPSFDLTGKVAMVTGGGRGLGRAIAVALSAAGAEVVVTARSPEQVAEVAASLEGAGRTSHAIVCDLASPGAAGELAATVAERCGGVDVVVHAAGTQVRKPALEITHAEWDGVIALNVTAPFFLSQALMHAQLPHRPVRRHIFVASLTSSIGLANTSAYGASKAAVMGVVRSLAVEWAPLGVTVNAIQPGYFRTALTEAVFTDEARHAWVTSRIPLGHVGEGRDLGGAAVFLASDAASYVTGQAIAVDGGWLAG
jgi:NAD(P)-dependent dehydrogenase (short-subunit alcohol dehydrogenase family)